MREISKKIFDAVVSWHGLRPTFAWVATKIRQNKRIRQVVNRYNPNTDPWVSLADEFAHLRKDYTVDFRQMMKRKPNKPVGLIAIHDDHVVKPFIESCDLLGLEPKIFDPSSNDCIEEIKNSDCEFYLSRPNHTLALTRELFLEKEDAIRDFLGKTIYPTRLESRIYEAKRLLAYFLQSEGLPHPSTFVSYSKNESLDFIRNCPLPQVFKSKNGAGSTGVEIVFTRNQGERLVKLLFDNHYINKSLSDYRDIDYGYIFFQEFVNNAREFRIIKVGDSWFGHEKTKAENQLFMSGSGLNAWTPPPFDLLDFCNNIAKRFGFVTMCFDVFMDEKGRYLINELQTWFGSYNPSQMYIDGIPGRYMHVDGSWNFEAGLFNDIQSVPLRLIAAINQGA